MTQPSYSDLSGFYKASSGSQWSSRTGNDYWVLSPDNLPRISGLSGLTEDELETMWADAQKFGHVVVFWRLGNRWYSIKVSAEYVFYGLLERSVEKAIEVSMHEQHDGDRRD